MDIKIEGTRFPIAHVSMDPGEVLIAESGAMVAYQGEFDIQAKSGGILSGLARMFFGGESFFQTYYTAQSKGAWIEITTPVLGDMMVIEASEGWNAQSGAFVARAGTVDMSSTKIGGITSWIGGEGLFMLSFSGTGPVILSAMGDLKMIELGPGESVVIDTGNFVAKTEGVSMEIGKVAKGIFSSIFSGEGLVFRFTGPGKIIYQTRDQSTFLGWIKQALNINS